MTRISKLAFVLMAATLIAGTQSSPADAQIVCDGPYQVFKSGGHHRSNLCENRYLAHVAGKYGMRVTARAVRDNPSVKAEVCSKIGHDIRVNDICQDHRPGRGGRRR